MGKLVVFWSPYSGVAKVTSSLCAITCILGIQNPETEVAICSALSGSSGPSEYLIEQRNVSILKEVYKKAGIEDLKLHFRQKILSSEIIRKCAVSLKLKSLYLYPETSTEKIPDEITFQLLTQTLKQEYDLVFLDLGSKELEHSLRFLENSDLVVIVLPQARRYWEKFLKEKETMLEELPYCLLISGYLGKSGLGKKYCVKDMKCEKDEIVGVIPMNTDYFYALEEGRLLDFFYRNQMPGKREENYEFIVQTKKTAERIRKKLFLC